VLLCLCSGGAAGRAFSVSSASRCCSAWINLRIELGLEVAQLVAAVSGTNTKTAAGIVFATPPLRG
jgi:hypothetical protein